MIYSKNGEKMKFSIAVSAALFFCASLSAMEKAPAKQSKDYRKWLSFAYEDLKAADTLMSSEQKFPKQAIVLAVQSAEKSLKAYLVYKKVPFTRTHDLKELLKLFKEHSSTFEEFDLIIFQLHTQPHNIRYPNKNTLINPEGISDYKKRMATILLKNAHILYDFVTEKINAEQETLTSHEKISDQLNNALLEAVELNDTELVDSLLQFGAEINSTYHNGESLLFIAVDHATRMPSKNNFVERQETRAMVKFLLRNGADVNIRNNDGETPLFAAAGVSQAQVKSGAGGFSIKLVKLLLKHGADANIQNKNGETVLTAEKRNNWMSRKRKVEQAIQKYQTVKE